MGPSGFLVTPVTRAPLSSFFPRCSQWGMNSESLTMLVEESKGNGKHAGARQTVVSYRQVTAKVMTFTLMKDTVPLTGNGRSGSIFFQSGFYGRRVLYCVLQSVSEIISQ